MKIDSGLIKISTIRTPEVDDEWEKHIIGLFGFPCVASTLVLVHHYAICALDPCIGQGDGNRHGALPSISRILGRLARSVNNECEA